MRNTSYYDECATLLIIFKNNHTRRLIALAVMMLLNFYLQTFTFVNKYTGENIASIMYANDGKAVSLGMGLGGLLYTAAAFVGGVVIFKKVQSNKIRFGYIAAAVTFMAIMTIRNNIASAHNVQGAGVGMSHMAFGMGMLTLILSLACLALAFFGDQLHPKLYAVLLVMLCLGALAKCFHLLFFIPMMLMYLLSFPEYKKMSWIKEQPGYPYFNERFDEQLSHSDYEPMHRLDHLSYAEMADITDENPAPPVYNKEKELRHQENQRVERGDYMTYTLRQGENAAEMPGIEDIREIETPMPEPEVPDAAAIPDPVWNVPEPAESPAADNRWEMPDANWDVPDVASDIPDLPDIPDIPKL